MWDDKISFHKRRDEDRGQNETRVRYEKNVQECDCKRELVRLVLTVRIECDSSASL